MSTKELVTAEWVDFDMPAERIHGKEIPADKGTKLMPVRPVGSLSAWSGSSAKRVFDIVCVLCSLPCLLPVMLLVGLAVRLTSRGPVLFRQVRMGRDGQTFRIMKFRTMVERPQTTDRLITISSDDRFTPVGPFLRRWKLDEVPQLLHVLMGQMSLIGPRPKVPEHEPEGLCCRPGITGAATLAFAREEQALDRVPPELLDEFYNNVVLPVKRQIDAEYMGRATFRSDLAMICNSLFGRWDSVRMRAALDERHAEFLDPEQKQPAAARPSLRRTPVSMRVMEVSSAEGDSV